MGIQTHGAMRRVRMKRGREVLDYADVSTFQGQRYQITLMSALLEGRGYRITLMSALFKVKDIRLR
jgi:hypothetical protein